MKRYADVLSSVGGVTSWVVRRNRVTEHQRFLLAGSPEAERTVDRTDTDITIFHDGAEGQGEGRISLFGADAPLEHEKVEEALFRAKLQSNPPYALPGPGAIQDVRLEDPLLAENAGAALDGVQDRVFAAVAAEKSVRLSSCEIFVQRSQPAILTSAGMQSSYDATSVLFEIVLLAESGEQESESHGGYQVRRLSDLNVEEIVRRHATRARDALVAELPSTREGPVVLSEGTFVPLFGPFTFATSGNAIYRKMSRRSIGDPILGDREVRGDALALSSDPTLAFATESSPYDGDGLCLSRVPVIADGTIQAIAASKRFADYLDVPATGDWRNRVVPAGAHTEEELLDVSGGPVFRIVDFSWLNPNNVRGTFSTEIRLGYEISKRGTRVIKGGSFAGNVFDAFSDARFTRETALVGNYSGPISIRFGSIRVDAA